MAVHNCLSPAQRKLQQLNLTHLGTPVTGPGPGGIPPLQGTEPSYTTQPAPNSSRQGRRKEMLEAVSWRLWLEAFKPASWKNRSRTHTHWKVLRLWCWGRREGAGSMGGDDARYPRHSSANKQSFYCDLLTTSLCLCE